MVPLPVSDRCDNIVMMIILYMHDDLRMIIEVLLPSFLIDKLNLFADMGDKIVPVTKSADGRTFEVSWVKPLDKSYSKTYEIKVYDEEGYSQLKRAQRSNTDAGVNPLFKIDLRHPGTYKGPWLQSERVAAVASILVCYLAFKQKFGFN